MKLTEQQLLRIFPNARLVAGVFVAALQRAMDERRSTHRRGVPRFSPRLATKAAS